MVKAVKEIILNVIRRQDGMALPAVLAMFAIGSLMIVPSISFVATNLKAGSIAEREFKGILAADAGAEDALWKLRNDTPTSFPYQYQIVDVNGLSVNVTIDSIDEVAGEEVGETGHHEDWLIIERVITFDAGIYSYAMSVSNNGSGNFKVVKILIDFPPGVEYVSASTSSNITNPANSDPAVSGAPTTGITLLWENSPTLPRINPDETEYHYFDLSGPAGIEDIEGHGFVEVNRDDIGTVRDSDSVPYSIIARAIDVSGAVVATIRVGIWAGSQLDISYWQIVR